MMEQQLTMDRVLTFADDSGGSVKTALAASRRPTAQLLGLSVSPQFRRDVDLMEGDSA